MLDQLIEALEAQLTPTNAATIATKLIQAATAGDGHALLALAVLSSGPGRKPARKPREAETPILTPKGELACPKCNGGVWDNRERITKGEFSPKSPAFACRDKGCGWATWSKAVPTSPPPAPGAPTTNGQPGNRPPLPPPPIFSGNRR